MSTSAPNIMKCRCEIAAERREADAAAFWRDVAHGPGGLEAMVERAAPPLALVIEDAARIEAEVAADRAHVAMGRPGDRAGSLAIAGKSGATSAWAASSRE